MHPNTNKHESSPAMLSGTHATFAGEPSSVHFSHGTPFIEDADYYTLSHRDEWDHWADVDESVDALQALISQSAVTSETIDVENGSQNTPLGLRVSLGETVVQHLPQPEKPAFNPKQWIDEHFYNVAQAEESFGKEFEKSELEQLLQEFVGRYESGQWLRESDDDYREWINRDMLSMGFWFIREKLSWRGPFSNNLAEQLIASSDPSLQELAVTEIDAFPDVTLTSKDVDRLIVNGNGPCILAAIDRLDSSLDRQGVVNKIFYTSSGELDRVAAYLRNIPDDCRIPESSLVALSKYAPGVYTLIESLAIGKLTYIFENVDLCTQITSRMDIYSLERCPRFLAFLSIEDINQHMSTSPMRMLSVICAHRENVTSLGGPDEFATFIMTHAQVLAEIPYVISDLPSDLKEELFKIYSNNPAISPKLFAHFGPLTTAQYLELLKGKYVASCLGNAYDEDAVCTLFDNAPEAIKKQFNDKVGAQIVARREQRRDLAQRNLERASQHQIERDEYFRGGVIRIDTLGPNELADDETIVRGFEKDHCVKRLPSIAEQASDTTRNNMVMFHHDANDAKGTIELTEHDALQGYLTTLDKVIEHLNRTEQQESAAYKNIVSVKEHLSFIGEKEYKEAAAGILTYWKHLLDEDSSRQVFIRRDASSGYRDISSSEYMLDYILSLLSDEEINKYKGRLIIHESDLQAPDQGDIRVVILDDWTISGSQIRSAAQMIWSDRPDLAGKTELHLMVASKQRVAIGLEDSYYYTKLDQGVHARVGHVNLPIKAYYLAHHAPSMQNDPYSPSTHITGYHSSVDFGFDCLFSENNQAWKPVTSNIPLSNIQRPYKKKQYRRNNLMRFARLTGLPTAEFKEGGE